jgi:hypothetical protein
MAKQRKAIVRVYEPGDYMLGLRAVKRVQLTCKRKNSIDWMVTDDIPGSLALGYWWSVYGAFDQYAGMQLRGIQSLTDGTNLPEEAHAELSRISEYWEPAPVGLIRWMLDEDGVPVSLRG